MHTVTRHMMGLLVAGCCMTVSLKMLSPNKAEVL